jgi:hypothetical protein
MESTDVVFDQGIKGKNLLIYKPALVFARGQQLFGLDFFSTEI